MDLGLQGRKAIVTGGTRGIGRAIAERLAMEGADVAICARGADAIPEAVASLESHGVKASGAAVDVGDEAALKAWITETDEAMGGLDVLVANASALASEDTEKAWRAAFEIDVMGTVHTVKAAEPYLEKSDAAAIVAIASISALQYFGGVRAYNSMKAALINHMSNLAHALAPKGIRVNSISPGTIYFEGGVWQQREQEMPEFFETAMAMNPFGRMGTAEEVADATVFLASRPASFITGVNLMVDGGLTQGVQY